MVKSVLLIASLVVLSVYGVAQTNVSTPNSINVEIIQSGHSLLYAVNYERILLHTDRNNGIIVGIGVSPLQRYFFIKSPTSISLQCKIFKQLQNHTIEYGGVLTSVFYWEQFRVGIAGYLGYKYTFSGAFYIGISITPMLNGIKFSGDSSYDRIGPFFRSPSPLGAIRVGYNF